MRSASRRLPHVLAVAAALFAVAGSSAAPLSRPVLRVSATGQGLISSADGRIRCGARCSARFKRGTLVRLSAVPSRYFAFQSWSAGCVGSAPSCAVALDRSTAVRALFVRKSGELNVTVGGPGSIVSEPQGIACGGGQTNCTKTLEQGTSVTLTAQATSEGVFDQWRGACSGTSPGCDLVVGDQSEVLAVFRHDVPDPGPQTLFVSVNQFASVTSDPPGIRCPPTCDADFPSRTLVTLHATSRIEWSGLCVGKSDTCVIVLDRSDGVTGNGSGPAPPPPAGARFGLNLSVAGPGFVTGPAGIRCGGATGRLLDCEGLYRRGSTVVLRAIPVRYARFAGWGVFCSGKKLRCTVRVTAPKNVTATFRR